MCIHTWLVLRELRDQKFRRFLNMSLVGLITAIFVSAQMISHLRENSVKMGIDNIGPALKLVPNDVRSLDHARYDMKGAVFSERDRDAVRRALKGLVRVAEGRLLVKMTLAGRSYPIIGIDPDIIVGPSAELKGLRPGHAVAGSEAARQLALARHGTVLLGGRDFEVSGIAPSLGTSGDLAVFLLLSDLQNIFSAPASLNEIRLFPFPGVSPQAIAGIVKKKFTQFRVIESQPGEQAEGEVEKSLVHFRNGLYAGALLILFVCMGVGALLNISERKQEFSTLMTIGAGPLNIFLILVLSALLTGMAGAFLGYLLGASVILLYDLNAAVSVVWSARLFMTATEITTGAGVVTAIPAAITVIYLQDHVSHIQET